MTVHGSLCGSNLPNSILDEENNPSTVSLAYANQWEDIKLIRTLLAGARALRESKEEYLPKFELETQDDYDTRVKFAPLSNYFVAAHRNIVSRPFTKAVSLQGTVTDTIRDFCENVDGGGSDLHSFLKDAYSRGVAYGYHGIMVDYPSVGNDATLADERAAGGRPYWAHIGADSLIAFEESYIGGKKQTTHARILETAVQRTGFKESIVYRVRVLDHDPKTSVPPSWTLYEYHEEAPSVNGRWDIIASGAISLGYIPLVIFSTGFDDSGQRIPPLIDLAHLQIEHYQQSSSLKNVLQLAGFPMLTGNGVQAPLDDNGEELTLTVGPRAVLFAPANATGYQASWAFIEPAGTSIKCVMENIQRLERDMAMAGMQPLMRQAGGVTATAEAINAARAHAAAESWAMSLKDVAEQALAITSDWLDEDPTAEVYITTEFGIELKSNNDTADLILARDKKLISTVTAWDELKRRDFLGPQFDPSKEADKIKNDVSPPPEESKNLQANRPPTQAPSIQGRNDGG